MAMSWLKGLVGEPAQFIPAGQPIPGVMSPSVPTSGGAPADARISALEAQCGQLRKDVESIALFSRTLLTVMVERKVLTEDEFREAKKKIDMIDGKLDERAV
jgi:hypothetical protein